MSEPDPDDRPPTPEDETLADRSRSQSPRLGVVPREHYRIEGELARGGMGRILLARDVRLGRPVALKELLPGREGLDARFVREAVTTARLQHPAIVHVHEAGRWPDGAPFYAMKLVAGRPLDRVIAETRPEERPSLLPRLMAVVEAVAYAHDRRVIHRDLKPANVIVGSFGETVVVDWGLAKDLAAGAGEGAALTVDGAVVGTPAYMPREQARGEEVDERADVYALGALLYHALSGRPPFSGGDSSEVLRAVLSGPPPALETLQPETPPDLAAIVRKAMALEPAGRYPTAKELAEDLRRFEAGQLVGAHRYTSGDLLRRFARRHRVPLGVGASALAVLVGSAAVAVSRIARERGRAVEARREAEARGDELVLAQARAQLERDPTAALAWLKHYSPGAARWGAAHAIAADAFGRGVARRVLAGHTRGIRVLAFSPDGTRLASGSTDRTVRLWRWASGESRLLEGHDWFVDDVFFLPDGRLASRGGAEVRLWDLASGVSTLLPRREAVGGLAVSPDGSRLAIARGVEISLHDLSAGTEEVLTRLPGDCLGLAFSKDGRALLVGVGRDRAGFLDLATRRATTRPAANWDPSPTTAALAMVAPDGVLWYWEKDREPRRLGPAGAAGFLWFTPRADALLTPDDAGIRRWDVAAGRAERLAGSLGAFEDARASPDGAWVAAAAEKGDVQLWHRPTGAMRTLRGHRVRKLAFAPDRRTLVTGGHDGTIRVWDLDPKDRRVVGRLPGARGKAVFDGRTFATVGPKHEILAWEASTGAARVLPGHEGGIRRLRLSPDGATLASAGWDNFTRLFDLRTSRAVALPSRNHFDVAFSPDGRTLATGAEDRQVKLWRLDGSPLRTLGRHELGVGGLAFSPDGRTLATTGMPMRRDDGWRHDRPLRLWDVETGAVRLLEGHEDTCTTAAWSPDGTTLATGGMDQTIRLWDARTGAGTLLGRLEAIVFEVAYSPDGRYVVGWGDGFTTWLWEVPSRRRLPVPPGMIGGFTRDSHELLMVDDRPGGAASLLDLRSGETRSVGDTPRVAALAPDGRALAVEESGVAVLWSDVTPREPGALRAWLEEATDLRVTLPR
jgi:WD40 repeat protein